MNINLNKSQDKNDKECDHERKVRTKHIIKKKNTTTTIYIQDECNVNDLVEKVRQNTSYRGTYKEMIINKY